MKVGDLVRLKTKVKPAVARYLYRHPHIGVVVDVIRHNHWDPLRRVPEIKEARVMFSNVEKLVKYENLEVISECR